MYYFSNKERYIASNLYYLNDNISATGNITEENTIKTFQIEESEKIKELLNSFIEENEEGVDTSEWRKWKLDDKNYPVID